MSPHIVSLSPWPLIASTSLLYLSTSLVCFLALGEVSTSLMDVVGILGLVTCLWWRDVLRESYEGMHTTLVQKSLMLGFMLFIVTEVKLFFSFFWAFFNSSLSPDVLIGANWPPRGLIFLNPWSLPFLGSSLLLASGFLLTLAHHAFLLSDKYLTLAAKVLTLLLGVLFLFVQLQEYTYSEFTLSDGALGSVFYKTTGLHALHVIIGVLFLLFLKLRIALDQYTLEHHVSFEMAIYYYHLVDVVWLFVFFTYYYWGS